MAHAAGYLLLVCVFVTTAPFYTVISAPLDLNPIAEIESKYPINGKPGPQQIHIAYGDTPQQMTVMWSTPSGNGFESSTVHYGMAPNKYDLSASGKVVNFTLGNPDGLQFIHRVQLENLKPGQKYSYRVQSGDVVSTGYEFITMRDDLENMADNTKGKKLEQESFTDMTCGHVLH